LGKPAEKRRTEKGGKRRYRRTETIEGRRKLLAVFRVRTVEEVFRGSNIGSRDQRSRRSSNHRTSIRASKEREERTEEEKTN